MQDKRLTCLGSGILSFDIVTEREYPEGYIKQKTYSDHILLQEAGGACGLTARSHLACLPASHIGKAKNFSSWITLQLETSM